MNYVHDFPVWYVLYLVEDGDGDMDRESRPEAVSSSLLTLCPHPKTIVEMLGCLGNPALTGSIHNLIDFYGHNVLLSGLSHRIVGFQVIRFYNFSNVNIDPMIFSSIQELIKKI